jgi:NAD(P)-dependent dehydrogenase (short-subunit alcohol dehydrogenase family)
MRAQGGGSIINISSGTAWKGSAGFLHYVTSKAAIAGMSRALARVWRRWADPRELHRAGQYRIGDTGGCWIRRASARLEPADRQRPEVPEDLVGTAIFLASDASAFITGQTIHVDGGSVLT